MTETHAIEVREAEEELFPAIAALHARYYGGDPAGAERELRRRFLDPWSREESFVVVATDGARVAGMQTYTRWPYERAGKAWRTVQSGLSLVDEAYRRHRLFSKLLAKGHEIALARGIDFMIGFPLGMSHDAFRKDGWTDVGALRWVLKPLHPLKVLLRRGAKAPGPGYEVGPEHRADPEPGWDASFERALSHGLLRAPASREAFAWRYGGREGRWKFFRDRPGDARVIFVAKSRTKHGFRELMVGDALTRRGSTPDEIWSTLRALVADAKRAGNVDAVTALVNPACEPLWHLFRSAGCWRTSQTVPFIAKGVRTSLGDGGLSDPASWSLLFSDADTW